MGLGSVVFESGQENISIFTRENNKAVYVSGYDALYNMYLAQIQEYDFEKDEYNLKKRKYEDYYHDLNEVLELHFKEECEDVHMLLDIRDIQTNIYNFDKELDIVGSELWEEFKAFHQKFIDHTKYRYQELFIMNMMIGFRVSQLQSQYY